VSFSPYLSRCVCWLGNSGVLIIAPDIWCDVNFFYAYCLFVLLRVDEQVIDESQVEDPERSSLKASCALDHSYLPNNVHVNHYDLHRLILMGPNRSP
jgi:hypothetical protein